MKPIKTLTLNGNTYEITDDAARIQLESLSAEQIDSRMSVDGMEYSTAGAAVRALEKTLKGGGDSKYIDGPTCFGYASNTSATWTELRHKLVIVPVSGGDVVEITASDTGDTYLYFLKTYQKPVVGQTIDFTDTTSILYEKTAAGTTHSLKTDRRCHLAMGVTGRFSVPDDTTCLLVYSNCKSIKVRDSEYHVVSAGLVETAKQQGERIHALEEAGANEKAVINIDNPYVRAYLMNTQYATGEWDETNGHPYFTREDVSAYSQYVPGGKDKATPFIVNIEPHEGALSYKLLVSENPGYTNAKELSATAGENKISWLKINRVYWIQAIATTADGDVVLREKTVQTQGVRRLNPLTSVQNLRDLGGQTTVDGRKLKQGLLYRCASLANITEEDVRVLEDVLDIKLVVGLAQNTEDAEKFSDNVETYHPLNLTQWDSIHQVATRQNYITYLRKIIEYLSQGKAVLFHCNAGADRTGLMSAIIEGLCGVSENDICKDYELTSFAVCSDANGEMTSRTRRGSLNADGTYRQLGFDGGIWYVRQQSGETFADKWKACLQLSHLATDGFEPLTDAEIEVLRKALIAEQ